MSNLSSCVQFGKQIATPSKHLENTLGTPFKHLKTPLEHPLNNPRVSLEHPGDNLETPLKTSSFKFFEYSKWLQTHTETHKLSDIVTSLVAHRS